tara:strand:+ start:1748 stop:1855 length:108 start_codon:yes stop_codon:yes gene_type:complete
MRKAKTRNRNVMSWVAAKQAQDSKRQKNLRKPKKR